MCVEIGNKKYVCYNNIIKTYVGYLILYNNTKFGNIKMNSF